jgi:hypothetical protein
MKERHIDKVGKSPEKRNATTTATVTQTKGLPTGLTRPRKIQTTLIPENPQVSNHHP